jgi:hypothetical protein
MSTILESLSRLAMRRGWTLVLVLLFAAATPALQAQGTPRHTVDGWRAPRVLKWTLLAASVGLGWWAYTESNRADDAYRDLRRLCDVDQARCTVTGGAYVDARAEALYARSNAGDRRARMGLLTGQATLLGSAAFFIVDLRHGGAPENIPYDPPAAAPPPAKLRVGFRIALP